MARSIAAAQAGRESAVARRGEERQAAILKHLDSVWPAWVNAFGIARRLGMGRHGALSSCEALLAAGKVEAEVREHSKGPSVHYRALRERE